MEGSIAILLILWIAAKLYRHSIPVRVAQFIGVRGGHANTFLFDDFDEQWRYKFNKTVKVYHPHVKLEMAVGFVRWRDLPSIAIYSRLGKRIDEIFTAGL